MKTKTLRQFQANTIEGALEALRIARNKYAEAGEDAALRAVVSAHHGTMLLEAPTGSGKTLMAAAAVETFSLEDDVVWLWFAPFKGIVGQTVSFLKGECSVLRVRDLATDRSVAGTKRGDIFVTTWQTVAVRDTNRRTLRKDREDAPSLDALLAGLREMGLKVGIVVDEAHHSFSAGTLAAALCRDVIRPDYTLLVTATPNDKDIAKWQESHGVKSISRLTASREDAVKAGLIKVGVKAVSYLSAKDADLALIDFESAAMHGGVKMHRYIREQLKAAKINLTPLLLVQVDSKSKDSVARAKARLMKLGFPEEVIATHTADEPDPNLTVLANNEKIEVLIFKMAVALGFDVPRAWTLVSMRSAKDEEFGVQLIGRILRVHRRLFGRVVPDSLAYGYVFLADPEMQTGLEAAGERVNSFRTQCEIVAPTTTAIVVLGGKTEVQLTGPGGQTWLFHPEPPPAPSGKTTEPTTGTLGHGEQGEFRLDGGEEFTSRPSPTVSDGADAAVAALTTGTPAAVKGGTKKGGHTYKLRVGVPNQFKTSHLPDEPEGMEEECAKNFFVSAEVLMTAMKAKIGVHEKTVEVFTRLVQLELFNAELEPREVARQAEAVLMKNEGFHPKELKQHLRNRLRQMVGDMPGMEAPGAVDRLLNVLLVRDNGALLREAQRKALAHHALVEAAEPLPSEFHSEEPCQASMRNVYGIYPPKLNNWEIDFAKLLDHEKDNRVLWWHRNTVKQPWSVAMVRADGKHFYPDFLIGMDGRKTEDGVLLADPKAYYEGSDQAPKILAQHPLYGRAMIVYRSGQFGWNPVIWNEQAGKAALGPELDWQKAVVW